MSIFDSNLKNTQVVIKKNILAKNATDLSSVSLSNEYGKDLFIDLIVDDSVDNNVTVSFTGTDYKGIAQIWLYADLKVNKPIVAINNIFTLPKGTTTFKLQRCISDTYSDVSLSFVITSIAKVSVSYYFESSSIVVEKLNSSYTANGNLKSGKKYKLNIHRLSKAIPSDYWAFSLSDINGFKKNECILTTGQRIETNSRIEVNTVDSFYLDLTKVDDGFYIIESYRGSLSPATIISFTIVEVSEIPVIKSLDVKTVFYDNEGFVIERYKEGVTRYIHFENWEAWIDTTKLYINNGGVNSEILIADLPNWKDTDTIGVMGFIPYKQGGRDASNYSRETSTRLCLVTRLGNIYHNFPASNVADTTLVDNGIAKFDLSISYQTIGSNSESYHSDRIPSTNASLTTEQQKTYRYEPGLPAWNYTQHNANVGGFDKNGVSFGNGGQSPIVNDGQFKHIKVVHPFDFGTNPQSSNNPYQLGGHLSAPFAVHPKMTTFAPYVGINAKKNIILGTTNGGRTWYVLHELGIGTYMSKFGNSLDYSSIGTYTPNALSVSERVYISPSDAIKDPVNAFTYKPATTISSIVTTSGKTTITTTVNHDITDGTFIVFTKNAESTFNFLENIGITPNTSNNSVGNGRFYAAKVLTPTTFEILQCMGGMDEKVATHHIHSANTIKDGAIISCGETYPHGWIIYIPIPQIDDFEMLAINEYKYYNRYLIRLASSENGAQRAVGFVLNDDATQSFLFSSDDQTIDRGYVDIPNRPSVFKRNSSGLFRGKLSEIDDISKAVCILEMSEASLGLENKEGFYIVIGMSRKTYISKDATYWISLNLISTYQGEGFRSIYFISGTTVYKVSHK